MASAAQPLALEDKAEARLEQLVTPEVKDTLVKEFNNLYNQFHDLQKTPAVLPVSKEDLYYAAEEDWFYKKDGMTNTKTLQRFESAGSHIVSALSHHQATLAPAALAAAATPLPTRASRKAAESKQAGPFTPRSALRWLVKHAVLPGLAMAASAYLWRTVPQNALDLCEPSEEDPHRMPVKQVEALLDEVLEVTQGRPERYPLVEMWLASDRSVGPVQWLQQQKEEYQRRQQQQQQQQEEDQ